MNFYGGQYFVTCFGKADVSNDWFEYIGTICLICEQYQIQSRNVDSNP